MAGFLAALPLIGKVLDRVIPDPEQKAKAQFNLMELAQKGDLAELDADVKLALGQMEINKSEAAHSSIFVAGWRPFCGWVCGSALLYTFILQPFVVFIAVIAGVPKYQIDLLPVIEIGALMTVLLGMLGLTGARSYEKRNGVAQESLSPQ
jgi:hypothetical protein